MCDICTALARVHDHGYTSGVHVLRGHINLLGDARDCVLLEDFLAYLAFDPLAAICNALQIPSPP